jgi:hypothetical protein
LGDWDYIQNNGREIFQEESRRGTILRTGNGISQAFRKLDATPMETEKAHATDAITEGIGDASESWQSLPY